MDAITRPSWGLLAIAIAGLAVAAVPRSEPVRWRLACRVPIAELAQVTGSLAVLDGRLHREIDRLVLAQTRAEHDAATARIGRLREDYVQLAVQVAEPGCPSDAELVRKAQAVLVQQRIETARLLVMLGVPHGCGSTQREAARRELIRLRRLKDEMDLRAKHGRKAREFERMHDADVRVDHPL